MLYQAGEIICTDKSEKSKKYALIISERKGIEPSFLLVNLIAAKPFERESVLCIGNLELRSLSKKDKTAEIDAVMRVTGSPYRKMDLLPYGSPVGFLEKDKLKNILAIVSDRNAYNQEKTRLSSIKDALHKRLCELKKQKQINKLNSIDYTDIDKKMDEISLRLGYEFIDRGPRHKQFRVAPSKSIKIYLGGRAR